ncbi:hypothetical protein WH52_07275 [Tenacibaculum holothuriorum]|uniref:Lipoprotein n=1 Tax=Tenacibaculum holothuriorum TaxID=1635173 RepID=A0A1Y2PEV6_9FLAO|nr:DUF6265 family protein [Tenacibaculum holothuriorum]OSY88541.1 hypothetical protein WH52_07275 [Tenacibaculum holothuriorum]
MRQLILILLISIFTSCKTQKEELKPTWLIGKWKRVNEKPNKETFEFWNKDYTGKGFTLRDNDTVFKEVLSIVSINDSLTLKVEGVNKTATLFKITQQTDTSFIAENPTHDFPTKIKYWKQNKQLKAKVSNNKFAIDFTFKKLED